MPATEYAAFVNVAIQILTCESIHERADAGLTSLWNKLYAAAIRHCCSCDLVCKALRLQNGMCDSPVHVAVKHRALNVIAHVVVSVDPSSILCADAMGNSAIHLALQTRHICLGLLTCLLRHVSDLDSALISENIISDTGLSMAVRHRNPQALLVINFCTARSTHAPFMQMNAIVPSARPNASALFFSNDNCNALGYSGMPPAAHIPDSLSVIAQGSDKPRASILQYAQQCAPNDSVAAFLFAAWCGRRVECRTLWKKFNSLDSLICDSNGNSVLHYLATCDLEPSVLAHVPGIISDMAAFGLNFSIRNKYGFTPLHLAAVRCSGAPSSVLRQVFSVLMAFLSYSHGVLSDADNNMNTALHLSCFVGNVPLVNVLLSRAVDPTISNAVGLTPLQIALQQGHTEIAALLQDRMTLLLFSAARHQAFQFLLPLLNAGAHTIMKHGCTPILHIVAEAFSDASRDALCSLVEWGWPKTALKSKTIVMF